MKLNELEAGMIFKENDKRVIRYVKIWKIDFVEEIIYLIKANTPDGFTDKSRITSSRTPQRFHPKKHYSGYSLVAPNDHFSGANTGAEGAGFPQRKKDELEAIK